MGGRGAGSGLGGHGSGGLGFGGSYGGSAGGSAWYGGGGGAGGAVGGGGGAAGGPGGGVAGGGGAAPVPPGGQGGTVQTNQYDQDWQRLKNNAIDFGTNQNAAESYHVSNNFDANKWANQLTDGERNGIVRYTGSSYYNVNRTLRNTYQYNGGNPVIDGATSGLAKCRIAEDCVLYRGMTGGASDFANWLGGISVADLADPAVQRGLIGHVLHERAFMSCGTSTASGWGGFRLKVYVPKGTEGMYVDRISQNSGEYELLLNRGARFIIRDIEVNAFGELKGVTLQYIDNIK